MSIPTKKIASISLQLFFLGIAAWLIYLSFAKLSEDDWQHIVKTSQSVDIYLIMLGFLIVALSHWVRSERWLILIDGNDKKVPFSLGRSINAFGALMIGYLANMAMPRLGEVLRCVVLGRYEKKSTMELVGTTMVERAFDFVCLLLVFVLTLSMEHHILLGYIEQLFMSYTENKNWVSFFLVLGVGLVGLVLLLAYLIKKNQKVRAWILSIQRGIMAFPKMKRKWAFAAYTLLLWGLYVGGVKFAFWVFGGTEHLSWSVALAVIAVGSVAMIVIQGGIGAYQFMVMQILALYHIPEYMGFTVGWFLWLLLSAVSLVLGGVCYLLLPYLNRKS